MTKTNVPAATRQYLDGLNALDIDQVVGSFVPDATIRYPGLGTTNPEGFRQYLSQVKSVLQKFRIEDREVFGTENGRSGTLDLRSHHEQRQDRDVRRDRLVGDRRQQQDRVHGRLLRRRVVVTGRPAELTAAFCRGRRRTAPDEPLWRRNRRSSPVERGTLTNRLTSSARTPKIRIGPTR